MIRLRLRYTPSVTPQLAIFEQELAAAQINLLNPQYDETGIVEYMIQGDRPADITKVMSLAEALFYPQPCGYTMQIWPLGEGTAYGSIPDGQQKASVW